MSRRFALVTVCLTAVSAFLVGLIVAGALVPTTARGHETARPVSTRAAFVPPGAGRTERVYSRSRATDKTPWWSAYAAIFGNDCFKVLRSAKARMDIQDIYGMTALDYFEQDAKRASLPKEYDTLRAILTAP